jgi:site-specific recombinase XerD
MKFRLQHRSDLAASASPYRVVEQDGGEVVWANRFLDAQRVRGLNELSLRVYGHQLLHFIRWWAREGVDVMQPELPPFTEATLIDYVRYQRDEFPRLTPETINNRSYILRRLFRFYFQVEMPYGPCRLQRPWRPPFGGRCRSQNRAAADLRLQAPPRVIEPLSVEQVHRFWSSFRTARDIAIVGLLLLNGLRSCEVLGLELEDLRLSEGQLRVCGKRSKVRIMPLPPETIRLLDCYLKTERPLTNSPRVFVSLKGKARGQAMTKAGLRSLFRHHRAVSDVHKANPHRFRHTFGSDMIRAGVSLPALQRLMGHSDIETTMRYIQISPQDVYEEYRQAVSKRATAARIAQP